MTSPRSECDYIPVQSENDDSNLTDNAANGTDKSWKPFLRQLLVSSTTWSQYFMFGLCLGAPTVIIPQMRAEHGQEYVSQDMASWISSMMGFTAVPWPPIIMMLTAYIGRRKTYACGAVMGLIGFIVMVVSNSPQQILASYSFEGPMAAMQVTISFLVLTEYTSPHYRGVFLTVCSATSYWGIWAANAIGTFANWRYIAVLGIVCGVYDIATLFMWPESPYWLASKGRMEQCMDSHRWLKGVNPRSEKELQDLIIGQQQKCLEEKKRTFSLKEKIQELCINMKSKCVYKCLLMNLTLVSQYNLSGKMICSIYAIDIIKSITRSETEAYKGMLILDGVTVLGMYIGCYLSKKLARRVLHLSAGATAMVFLLTISLYLFLIEFKVVSANNVVTIILLTFYSLSISCGPILLNAALGAELLPLKMRDTSSMIIAITSAAIGGISLKVAPLLFSSMGMHGTFLFYGLSSSALLFVLYIYLPETKDKSLIQIEDMIIRNQ